MAISTALSALAGLARGGKTLIEKEEKETSEITKIGLKQTLENIATAKKNHATTMKEFREQMQGVKALQKFTYKDPETGEVRNVTQGQAISLIEATGGPKEAFKALQDAEIAFKGEGEVGPIQYTTAGAIDRETVEAFTDEDDTVGVAPLSLAKGRGARAMANVQKVVDKLGLPKDGYKTPVGLPEVSGVEIISTKNTFDEDIRSIEKGTITATINGKEQTTTAVIGNDKILYVLEDNKLKPAADTPYKNGAFAPKVSKTATEPTVLEAQESYISNYFGKGTTATDMTTEYTKKQASINVLGDAYSQMWPIAKNKEVYSVAATSLGNLVKRVDIELAGIKAIGVGVEKDRNSESDIKSLSSFIDDNMNATDLAIQAKVLDAMNVRAAYKFLVANGDTRPSDADLRRAMQQFASNSPQEFADKARSNWEQLTSETRRLREDILKLPAFSEYTVLQYSDTQREAIASVVEQRKPQTMSVNPPAFLMQDPKDLDIIEEPTEPAQDITIDVTIKGTTVQATYDPENDEIVIGNLSMSSTEAINAGYVSIEQLKALQD